MLLNRRDLLAGVFLVVILVGGMLLLRHHLGATTPMVDQGETVAAKTKGPADAPVQIVEYSDYQCPACRLAQVALHQLMDAYPGKIHLTYRHFPLKGHLWSPVAHQAAECANQKGKFWEYHNKLFENQKIWSTPENPLHLFLVYAKELGFDVDDFGMCLTHDIEKKLVEEDKKTGEALKVKSTPTFFVNGERLVGGRQLMTRGESVIREALGLPPKPVVEASGVPSPPPGAKKWDLNRAREVTARLQDYRLRKLSTSKKKTASVSVIPQIPPDGREADATGVQPTAVPAPVPSAVPSQP